VFPTKINIPAGLRSISGEENGDFLIFFWNFGSPTQVFRVLNMHLGGKTENLPRGHTFSTLRTPTSSEKPQILFRGCMFPEPEICPTDQKSPPDQTFRAKFVQNLPPETKTNCPKSILN